MMKSSSTWVVSLLLLFVIAVAPSTVHAQFSYRSTVGDASKNQFQPGATEANQYLDTIIANPTRRGDDNTGLRTRHSRLGNSTGIDGSSFQTTSVTSESRPALVRPSSISTGRPLIERPNLNLQFQPSVRSPALRRLEVQGPGGDENEFGHKAETFTSAPSPAANNIFSNYIEEFEFGQ